jgi:hypothetical protein
MIFGHHHHHSPKSRVPGPVKHAVGVLTLKQIQPVRRDHGGYKIEFHGTVPRHDTVCLYLGNNTRYSMDITGGYHKHRMAHLEQLLDLMDQGGFWGKKIPVRVAIRSGGKILQETLSPPQFIQCPLEPIREIGVEEVGSVEGLRYTGKPDGSGGGAFLSSPIGDKYFFAYDGMLISDPKRRGFDCTTYVGSAHGLPNGLGQGGDGKTVAEAIKAEPCDMEHKHTKAVREFFEVQKTGTYIMWRHGHVVVVKDCFVHEFTNRVSMEQGYCKTEVAEWLALPHNKNEKFSVRKVKT